MVGLVRWGRNYPRIKENLSSGFGLVRGIKRGSASSSSGAIEDKGVNMT
jgi:hypothetical protein